jgi:glucokinase
MNINNFVISVDLGGINTPVSLINSNGSIIRTIRRHSALNNTPKKTISGIINSCEKLIEYFNENYSKSKILGIGISSPGLVSFEKGIILSSPNMPHWMNIPIRDLIAAKISLPIFIDNDANCSLLAEHCLGIAKNYANAVLLTLGTGIGGAILIDNKIYRGSTQTGAEFGHMTISSKGPKCSCGNYGCLEAFAAVNPTLNRAKEKLKREELSTSLNNIKLSDLSIYDIYINAEKGDIFSQKILNESGTYLGIGIASLCNIFNPELVIIGGRFSRATKYLIPAASSEAFKRSFKENIDNCKIVKAKLGNRAARIGIAKMIFDNFNKKVF